MYTVFLFVCLFVANGYACFESVEHHGQHLGAKPDWSIKPPGNTGQGDHGQFYILVCTPVSDGQGSSSSHSQSIVCLNCLLASQGCRCSTVQLFEYEM